MSGCRHEAPRFAHRSVRYCSDCGDRHARYRKRETHSGSRPRKRQP